MFTIRRADVGAWGMGVRRVLITRFRYCSPGSQDDPVDGGDNMSNLGLLGLGSQLSFWVSGVHLELAGPDVVPGLWESVSHTV